MAETRGNLVWSIGLLFLGALSYTLNDTFTKVLIERYPMPIIIFVRGVLALPLLVLMAVMVGGQGVRWPRSVWPHAMRGAIGLMAAALYIMGLRHLSIAEATVLVFASPLFITLASTFVFGEVVALRKWVAVLVSFLGVIIAMRPGTDSFKPASLYILASAVLYATQSLSARWVRPEDSFWSVSFFAAAFSALFVSPFTIGRWQAFQASDILLFVGAALCSSLAIGSSTLAYRSAAASDLAPFAYSGLIWSTLVTWAVWGSPPQPSTLLGAAVVACSAVLLFVLRDTPHAEGKGLRPP